jgi:hypothetical protein
LGGLFAALVAFRVSTASITNDDYLHLSTAQQLLVGGVPVRDFLDPGELLFYSTSALAQVVLGRSVFSEVLLDACLLSLGQVLVFVLASKAAGSSVVGLLAAAFPVAIVSRLYSYPKTLLYVGALWLMWRYVDSRSARVLGILSVWTGTAFLFRHDHGAYIGLTVAVMLVAVHGWRGGDLLRTVGRFTVPLALIVLPFLMFLSFNGGIAFYVRACLDTAAGEYSRTVGAVPSFRESWTTAWHYYVTVAMAPATVLLLLVDWWRRRRTPSPLAWRGMDGEPRKLLCAAVLGVLMHTYLLRAKSDSAIADVSALTAVLGGWLIARGLHAGWSLVRRQPARVPRPSLARGLAALLAACATMALYSTTMQQVAHTAGGDGVRSFVRVVANGGDPWSPSVARLSHMAAPYDDEGARYVSACTADTDRLLITSGYRPELYYATGRGFAAGRLYYLNSLAPAPEFKTFSLGRLQAERVPLVLLEPTDEEFRREFGDLYRHVQQHYRPVGRLQLMGVSFDVLADSRIQPTRTSPQGLPCFR